MLEEKLNEAVQEWEQDIDQKADRLEDKELLDEFYEIWAEDNFVMQQHKVILMNSFFSASFALFEYQLTWLCNDVKRDKGSAFSVKDLKNSFTERVKVYLKKLEVSFPSDSPEWKEINYYQEIRNKIMHEGGYVSSEWEKLKDAQANGIINSSRDDLQLELTLPFCQKASNDFEKFLKKVIGPRKKVEKKSFSG